MKSAKYLMILMMMFAGSAAFSQSAVTAQNLEEVLSEDELPVVGVRYHYYPNLQAYYDNQTNLYHFRQNGVWVKGPKITSGYRGYWVMNNVKVDITDYNGDKPETRFEIHKEKHPANYSAKRKPPKKPVAENKIALN